MTSTENITRLQKYKLNVERFFKLKEETMKFIGKYMNEITEKGYRIPYKHQEIVDIPGISEIGIVDAKFYVFATDSNVEPVENIPLRTRRINQGLTDIIRRTRPTD